MRFSTGLLYLLLVLVLAQCKIKEQPPDKSTEFSGKPIVPSSVMEDHELLVSQLDSFVVLNDSAGRAAIKLKELVVHHFTEEEDYVLPVLGILPMLSRGDVPADAEKIIALTTKFRSQLNHITAEHQLISAYTVEMISAAGENPDMKGFAEKLHHHASLEQEALFPAVLVAGDYLKSKLQQ